MAPLIFLPLALAHAYGTAERMDLGTVIWRLRRHPPPKPVTVDPWFSYFLMWLVAAAAANVRGEWFYVGLIALVSWPLLRSRPRSYHAAWFGLALVVAVGLGYALQYLLARSCNEEAVPNGQRQRPLTEPSARPRMAIGRSRSPSDCHCAWSPKNGGGRGC